MGRGGVAVLGYPQIFPAGKCGTRLNRFGGYERKWLREVTASLDQAAARAVASEAAKGRSITYVSTLNAFAGHEICMKDSYMNGVKIPKRYSYHPNRAGQAALARPPARAFGSWCEG